MNTKISIIIPAYNGEEYIKRAIESVLNQTYEDFEIIIVDDFSRDNTVSIVKKLQKDDSRIKLICLDKNSGGPALPKNKGFEISQGEFIAYLDQDDEWMINKLQEQLDFFMNSPNYNLGLVSCGADLINDKGNCFAFFTPIKKKNIFPDILLRNPIYSNSGVMIKREVINSVGDRDEKMKYSEDLDMWIRIAKAGYKIDYLYKSLFRYQFHKDNATKTINKIAKVLDMEYLFLKHRDLYLKYNYEHLGYFRLGIMYLLGGDIKKSRQSFKNSIKINQIFMPAYFGYFFSMLGNVGIIIINFLIFIYRLINGKKYLLFSNKK